MLAHRLIHFSSRFGIKFTTITKTRLIQFENNFVSHLSKHSIGSFNYNRNKQEIFTRFNASTCSLYSAINNSVYFNQKRFRKKNPPKKVSDIEESESENEDEIDLEDSNENLEIKEFNTTVISCRLDAIGKTCFNISRAKFEQYFYDNLIRVNGNRVAKKSYELRKNDQIDLIRGVNMQNNNQLDINRIDIVNLDDKAASSGRYRITYRKTNKLTIENYKQEPYDGTLISS